jgi:hypothetical protein
MPGFMPGIHAFLSVAKTWMAGTSPAMAKKLVVDLFQSVIEPRLH